MQTRQVSIFRTGVARFTLCALLLACATNMPAQAEKANSAQAHDIYNPARAALINAQRQLAESYRQQQDVLARTARMHKELQTSLALLTKAEQLDPANKATIEALRSRLAALEDRPTLCPMDSQSSLDVYSQLLDEMQTLIEQY